MLVTLPNGFIDGGDHFNTAEIDELRGKQQDYLVNKELVLNNIGHVPKILEDMILGIQTASGRPWKGNISEAIYFLPSGDLETLLIKIRENTYGPKYYHTEECPHCGLINKDLLLKLDKLKLFPVSSEELIKPKVIVLPKEEVEVELKPAYLEDLLKSIQLVTGKQDKLLTSFLASSIKRIGDKHEITQEDVSNLRASDIEYIKEQAEEMTLEGHIDTDIQIECANSEVNDSGEKVCGKEFEVKLNCFEPNFFVHTRR